MNHALRSFAVKTTLAIATTLAFAAASATTLKTKLAVDDVYFAYLSTSDGTQGTQFSFAADWSNVATGTVELGAEQQYFLHIAAYDNGGSGGLLGEFSLAGTGYHFADTPAPANVPEAASLGLLGLGLLALSRVRARSAQA